MKQLYVIHTAAKKVFSERKYVFIGVLSMALWIVLGIAFTNIKTIINVLTMDLPFSLRLEAFFQALALSLSVYNKAPAFFLVATSMLVAVNISMIAYTAKKMPGAPKNSFGFAGMVAGSVSSTCAACATSLLSLLGLSGAIFALPFKGAEIFLLSILLLTVSLYYTAKSIVKSGICKPLRRR